MDFERLERAWRSPANTPADAAAAYLTEDVMDELKRRREATRRITLIAGGALVLWTGKIAFDWITAPFPFDLSREWAAVALLVLPWVALAVVVRSMARHAAGHPDPYASMPDTLRALIDENAQARTRVKVMAGIMAIAVAGLAVALWQLVDVGKMTPGNVRDGALLFGAVLGVVWTSIGVNYFTRLRPEALRLRRLLADYGG